MKILYHSSGVTPNLLLDTYPGASPAYSVRKLRNGYTGYCMKVRRSSDNSEQDIGFTSGWLDESALTTFVGAGTGYVSVWYDQSGNGYNATQATLVNQPKIAISGNIIKEGGKPIIDFGTGSEPWVLLLPTGQLYNWTALSFFMVHKTKRYASSNSGVFAPSGSYQQGLMILQHDVISIQALLRINSTTARNNNTGDAYRLWNDDLFSLLSVFGDSVAVSAYKSSVAVTLTNSAEMPALNYNGQYAIGYYYSLGNNSYTKIAEIIIYNTNKKSVRSNIEGNINGVYSIY